LVHISVALYSGTEKTDEYTAALAKWKKKEGIARHMLWSYIPNSILARVSRMDNVAEMWEWIVIEFTQKSMSMQAQGRI